MRRHLPTALLLTLIAAVGVGALMPVMRGSDDGRTVLTGPTMGTRYRVVIRHEPGAADRERWRELIESPLDRIDRRMSTWRSDSTVSRFNRSEVTDWFEVSASLARLARQAQRIAEATGGAFDLTVAPLVDLWGFGPGGRAEALPDDAAVREALERVGYEHLNVRMDPSPALKKAVPGVAIDLSAIAKGHAADGVAGELASLGAVRGCLVEVGGEIRVRGRGPGGRDRRGWRVGIEAPTFRRGAVSRRIALPGGGLATSGDYRNFFMEDGERYSHTLDPRTGRPVRHSLASVSVAHDSAALADAWATALLVLGPEEGYELAKRKGLAACFMSRDQQQIEQRMTPAFRAMTIDE